MCAAAVETPLELPQPRLSLLDPAEAGGRRPASERRASPRGADTEPWELHSELALVCPEVRRRALELMCKRDPYDFLPKVTVQPSS
jgi:hypothetical protein